jgi:hypothetical protein
MKKTPINSSYVPRGSFVFGMRYSLLKIFSSSFTLKRVSGLDRAAQGEIRIQRTPYPPNRYNDYRNADCGKNVFSSAQIHIIF